MVVALMRCPGCRTELTRPDISGEDDCPRCGRRMRLVGISRGVIRTDVKEREEVRDR